MKCDLRFGDCLELMSTLSDNSINSIITDLPYYKIIDEKWDNQWKNEDEYLYWVKKLILEWNRILTINPNLFIFTGRQYNRKIANILDQYFEEKRIIIWSRKRNFNNTRGKALASGYEPICYYSKGNSTFNTIKLKINSKRKEYTDGILKDGITLSDVWSDIPALPHNSKEKIDHPTQKPLQIIERLILLGTNENDTILDCCMGSGTVGHACKNLNRNFVGFENNKEYFKIAKKRIES